MVDWLPIREAWSRALYGPAGFYRREWPADHFRTSPHISPAFAEVTVLLCRRWDLDAVVDLGAGGGEFLADVRRVAPDLRLLGVDLRGRPADLDAAIEWHRGDAGGLPTVADSALVIANEVVDNVPCDVVEVDPHGRPRIVEVDPETGDERLGEVATETIAGWLHRWWPIDRPGERAEVGLARDEWWSDLVARNGTGVCVAVDYGHLVASRPAEPTLVSYRRGRLGPPAFDGDHDLTAHVAVDSIASAAGAWLTGQRQVFRQLGISGTRPPIEAAHTDPRGYLTALRRASEIGELTDSTGLGGFWWIVSGRRMGA